MKEYPDTFDEIVDEPHTGVGNGSDKEAKKPRFHLEALVDIELGDGPEWLIADIVPAAGFTVIR